MSKVTRVVYPDWLGGANRNYAFGCDILSRLMPQTENTHILRIPVSTDYYRELQVEDGITEKSTLLRQQMTAKKMIEEDAPDKIIVIGGPCSAEQAQFNYLHNKYPDAGLIWIDVHPDITRTGDYPNEHAMVLGNLLGDGAKEFAELVDDPFKPENVMYAGMKLDEMETYEKEYMKEYRIKCAPPEMLRAEGTKCVTDWIKEKGFEKIIVHWDLDVLSPESFRSLLCNEPLSGPTPFVVGAMHFDEILQLILDIERTAEIVGLGICEYMPWDAINLTDAMNRLQIFKDE